LDGDQFDVIWDPRLVPSRSNTQNPADYPKIVPQNIGRTVVTADMMKFFIEFMENDRVGQISSLHLQVADRMPEGTKSPECIQLAKMASTAVDYAKSGIPVSQFISKGTYAVN
jgi:hypothetical protein